MKKEKIKSLVGTKIKINNINILPLTRVLMSNGMFKCAKDIKKNDIIINKDGKPAKILQAFAAKDSSKLSNYQNSLKNVKNISFVTPKAFYIDLQNNTAGIDPDYNSGYIFGSFLSNKTKCTEYGVYWYLENKSLRDKLNECIYGKLSRNMMALDKNPCVLYYRPFVEFLQELVDGGKHLPDRLLVSNEKYLKGLLKGLEDSEQGYDYQDYQVMELFNVVTHMVTGEFPEDTEIFDELPMKGVPLCGFMVE